MIMSYTTFPENQFLNYFAFIFGSIHLVFAKTLFSQLTYLFWVFIATAGCWHLQSFLKTSITLNICSFVHLNIKQGIFLTLLKNISFLKFVYTKLALLLCFFLSFWSCKTVFQIFLSETHHNFFEDNTETEAATASIIENNFLGSCIQRCSLKNLSNHAAKHQGNISAGKLFKWSCIPAFLKNNLRRLLLS